MAGALWLLLLREQQPQRRRLYLLFYCRCCEAQLNAALQQKGGVGWGGGC